MTAAEEWTPDPRRWRALAVVLVAGFMVLLDVSIVNVALPSIAAGTGASDSALQWVVSGYALAFGLVLVAGGRIGDARGRRPTLITGLVVFVLASAACGAARGPGMSIVGLLAGWVVIGLVDGPMVGWAVAPAFRLAGVGNGLVISPNQTLTLSEVPPAQGGAAGGVLQTGQRIGSAAGIAAIGSTFYAELSDFTGAVRTGFLLVVAFVAFVAVALAVAVADLVTDRRRRRSEDREPATVR